MCRFECCSSDAMSVGQTSSSAVMEVSSSSQSGSPFPSTPLSGPTGFVRHPGVPSNCSNLSVTTNTSSISSATPTSQSLAEHSGGGIAKDLSESYMVESLRWEKQCSDEEKEIERIEVYKANRRKRYENALEERRKQLVLTDTRRHPYYASHLKESTESVS